MGYIKFMGVTKELDITEHVHTFLRGTGMRADARENDECANEGHGLVYEGKLYQPNTGLSEEGILWS